MHHIILDAIILELSFPEAAYFCGRKVLIEDSKTPAKDTWFTLYYLILGVYGGIQLFLALLFRIPFLRSQADRCSDVSFLQFFKWVKEVLLALANLPHYLFY